MTRPPSVWAATGLLTIHGALLLGVFVYGWGHLEGFARLSYRSWPPCSGVDSCDPAWAGMQAAWFGGFLLVGLLGQILLLAAAGVWFRSSWTFVAVALCSLVQLLLALRLVTVDLWSLGALLVPLPIAELLLLARSGRRTATP